MNGLCLDHSRCILSTFGMWHDNPANCHRRKVKKCPQTHGSVSQYLLLRPGAAHAIDVQPCRSKCGITSRNGYKYEKAHFGCNGPLADDRSLLDQHRSPCCKNYPGCCKRNQSAQGQQGQGSCQSKKGLCKGSCQGKEAHCQKKDAGNLDCCCQKGRLYRPFTVKTNRSQPSGPCI